MLEVIWIQIHHGGDLLSLSASFVLVENDLSAYDSCHINAKSSAVC